MPSSGITAVDECVLVSLFRLSPSNDSSENHPTFRAICSCCRFIPFLAVITVVYRISTTC
jgi:hypothetical protein